MSFLRRLAGLPKRAALEVLRKYDPIAYARTIGVRVGENCQLVSTNFGTEPYLVTLGDRVAVAQGVCFITHDGGVWVFRDQVPEADVFGPIIVKDHAMIGANALILPGVTIGRRALVAAGAVVAKDVPDECVVAGTPAKVIATFEQYKARSLVRSLGTKRLDPKTKTKRIKEHFNVTADSNGTMPSEEG